LRTKKATTGAMRQSLLVRGGAKTAVELTWTYSNQKDLADMLRRARMWLSEDHRGPVQDRQVSVRARPNSTAPRRVAVRLGEAAVLEIIEARRAGEKLRDVASRYGISESSVKILAGPNREGIGGEVSPESRWRTM
jgi:hypothetical protein